MRSSDALLQLTGNVMFSYWEELLRLRRLVLKNCKHEDIHDLRVASRRFRVALNILAPVCGSSDAKKLSRAIRRVTRSLGNVRNLDEALFFFGSRAGETGLTSLMNRLTVLRNSEQDTVLRILKRFKAEKFEQQVRQRLVVITGGKKPKVDTPPLQSYLSTTSIDLFETIYELLPSALFTENVEERHALRIAIKKWRYFVEIASKILEQDYDEVLGQLKKYQSLLGSMNDMTVFAEMLRHASVTSNDRADAERLIASENDKLFVQFIALVEAEPLRYAFIIKEPPHD